MSEELRARADEMQREREEVEIADDAVNFVFDRLAEKLGLAEWQVVEGSEDWHGDVSATLHRLLTDAGVIDDETGAIASLSFASSAAGQREGKLGYHSMGSGGRCDWTHLAEAVAEATSGSRAHSEPFDPAIYAGHHMVKGLNFNSLDRIVTAFVDAALIASPSAPEERRDEVEDTPPDEDWLTDVIDDSLDMDWTGRVGARAIIAAWSSRHD